MESLSHDILYSFIIVCKCLKSLFFGSVNSWCQMQFLINFCASSVKIIFSKFYLHVNICLFVFSLEFFFFVFRLTENIFKVVSQAIFSEDLLLFAFHIYTSIERAAGRISPEEWNVFLHTDALSDLAEAHTTSEPETSKDLNEFGRRDNF